jgi:hypothetical protein
LFRLGFCHQQSWHCKHIEFTLAKLEAKRGGKTAQKTASPHSEIYFRHKGHGKFVFGLNRMPAKFVKKAKELFDKTNNAGLPHA